MMPLQGDTPALSVGMVRICNFKKGDPCVI